MKAIKEELLKMNLPKLEEKVLNYWETREILEKILKKGKKKFVFFEGPPFLNGKPHLGHFFTRAIKDVILRYRTMKGYHIEGRRAGWDTHGLPTELNAERSLGISSKKDIEKYGIEKFTEKCKEKIFDYKPLFDEFSKRIAYSVDLNNAYITCDNSYIESVWWIIKKLFRKKLLYQDYKIVPYCPRCGTSLSSHEVAQGYKKVSEPSIFLKFKIENLKSLGQLNVSKINSDIYLLAWTTTPWTLPANVALAVNPNLIYVLVKASSNEYFILLKERLGILDENYEVLREFKGKVLEGIKYKPIYQISESQNFKEKIYKILGADFVSSEEGTGIVHIAPAFGEDDFELIKSKIPELIPQMPIPVNERGEIKMPGYNWDGLFVKKADPLIIEDLKNKGNLYKEKLFEHDYPFCWRCGGPLLYYPKKSWFVKTSSIKRSLVKNNQKINWSPSYLKKGRFGEWLENVKDWNLSRERYWGTPLPVWKCKKCGKVKVISSIQELSRTSFHRNNFYLLRHGQAENNVLKVISDGDYPLTSLGKKEIERVVEKIKKFKIDVIYSSPIKRCFQTAEIIANKIGLKVLTDDRLREINAGIFNNKDFSDYINQFKSVEERFYKRPKGGESLEDVKNRVIDFVIETNRKYQNKNILIVSHQDPLFVLEVGTYGIPVKDFWRINPMSNGEIREISFSDNSYTSKGEIDLHRPYIDRLSLKCSCGGEMVRVKEVIDGWFDSGSMPFAQWHYPFENRKKIDQRKAFPADFISEGIDQTRGWFYTLLAISTLLGFRFPPYKNVVSLGLILDKKGYKMSKSKGNAVEADEIIKKFGVDVIRWYFYAVNLPEENKQFNELDLTKTFNKFFNPLLNGFKFFNFYGGKKDLKYRFGSINNKNLNLLEKWMISRFYQTVKLVDDYLNNYQIKQAASSIETLISDFSTWYLRRSRKNISLSFLGYLLLGFSKLLAPFIPFISEAIYVSLKENGSVHLEEFPEFKEKEIDYKLLEEMSKIREISSKILSLREEKQIKVKQPLAKITLPEEYKNLSNLIYLVLEETNIKKAEFKGKNFILDTKITQDLYEEGIVREITRLVQQLRKKIKLLPKDKIKLMIEIENDFSLKNILVKNDKNLKEKIGAVDIIFGKKEKFEAEISKKINNSLIWLGIKKV